MSSHVTWTNKLGRKFDVSETMRGRETVIFYHKMTIVTSVHLQLAINYSFFLQNHSEIRDRISTVTIKLGRTLLLLLAAERNNDRVPQPSMFHVKLTKTRLRFSFVQKNGTVRERLRVKRGMENIKDLGRVVEFKDQRVQTVWNGEECNELKGTDSTIFPPFLTSKDKIRGFLPDLCRYIVQHQTKYLL